MVIQQHLATYPIANGQLINVAALVYIHGHGNVYAGPNMEMAAQEELIADFSTLR